MKEQMKERLALGAVMAGMIGSVASGTADVLTCPGKIEHPKDTPVLVCDENPGSDDLLNNPGTDEQKLLYISIVMGTLGGVALTLLRARRNQVPIQPAPMEQ